MKPSKIVTAKTKTPNPSGITAVQSLGPRRIGESVLFIASFPQAHAVNVAGDFNNWRPEKTPMTKAFDGTWHVTIPLAKGVYRYRLVIDGNWQQDPHNNATEPNQYGELNSVLKVD